MILVLGDITVDITAPLAASPVVGEDCLSPELAFQCGGVGVNMAITLARLGAAVRLVGCIGKEWFGNYALDQLRREGIDLAYVQQSERALTGLMYIVVTPDGQRTIFGSRGANAELQGIGNLESCTGDAVALILSGYSFLSPGATEVARQLVRRARSRRALVALDVGGDPSQRVGERLRQAAGQVDVLLANSGEAATLTGQADGEQAFRRLEQTGAREVVLKLGNQGCLIRNDGEPCRVPPFDVQPVDTTGAGDAFTAAYVAGRVWGWSRGECAILANAAGAAAATTMGAGERLPATAAVRELLAASRLPPEWDRVRGEVHGRLRAVPEGAVQSASGGA